MNDDIKISSIKARNTEMNDALDKAINSARNQIHAVSVRSFEAGYESGKRKQATEDASAIEDYSKEIDRLRDIISRAITEAQSLGDASRNSTRLRVIEILQSAFPDATPAEPVNETPVEVHETQRVMPDGTTVRVTGYPDGVVHIEVKRS